VCECEERREARKNHPNLIILSLSRRESPRISSYCASARSVYGCFWAKRPIVVGGSCVTSLHSMGSYCGGLGLELPIVSFVARDGACGATQLPKSPGKSFPSQLLPFFSPSILPDRANLIIPSRIFHLEKSKKDQSTLFLSPRYFSSTHTHTQAHILSLQSLLPTI
jgi:hypothetical protein